MTGGRDNERAIDRVRIHARLVVVVHGHEGPVCDHSSNADVALAVGASDEVLNTRGVEQLHVRELQDF